MSETLISPATSSQISQTRQMFIGGEWVDASDGQRFESTNPYTGKVWATAPSACADDIDRAVSAARRALAGPWGEISATGRGHLILAAAGSDRAAASPDPCRPLFLFQTTSRRTSRSDSCSRRSRSSQRCAP